MPACVSEKIFASFVPSLEFYKGFLQFLFRFPVIKPGLNCMCIFYVGIRMIIFYFTNVVWMQFEISVQIRFNDILE